MVPLASWLARFIPDMHISKQALILKLCKKYRLVFDSSFRVILQAMSINDITIMNNEPEIENSKKLWKSLI